MNRRSFLTAAGSACLLSHEFAVAETGPDTTSRTRLQTFDYRNVRLLPSRFADQARATRELYFNLPDDDLLKGFRRAAGLPAPGSDLRGWSRKNTGATFGQWISGMARLSCATGDTALSAKKRSASPRSGRRP